MAITDKEWRAKLTPDQYDVLRNKGTETPFSGKLLHNKDKGVYACVACGSVIFDSKTKFESGSGWPSFYNVSSNEAVTLKEDDSHSMQRVEVSCSKCGGHLGHVFHDAPETPTGMRFCINSCALDFRKAK